MIKDIKYYSRIENAEERYKNLNNPYDTEYPFLRRGFEELYRNSIRLGIPFSKYYKGYFEGKYVIPSRLSSPFIRGTVDSEDVIENGQEIYRGSEGRIDRIYRVAEEANGLCVRSRSFYEDRYDNYQTLVNFFNAVNGEGFAKIVKKDEDSYYVCMSPIGTGGEFEERIISLENAIALDYHPPLTKVELLPYIRSIVDREFYMEDPSADMIIDIFCRQLKLNKEDIVVKNKQYTK